MQINVPVPGYNNTQPMSEQDRKLKYLKDQYNIYRNKGDWENAARIQDEMRQQRRFNENLARYDEEKKAFADEVRSGFRHFADVTQANQINSLNRNVGMAITQRGLQDSGLGAALMTGANTALAGQTAAQVSGFEADLASAMRQEREAFMRGEFDYMNRLNQMRYQTDLEKELQAYVTQLQVDASKRSWLGEVLNLGGQVMAAWMNPGGFFAGKAASAFSGSNVAAGYSPGDAAGYRAGYGG